MNITRADADFLRLEIARQIERMPLRILVDFIGTDPAEGKMIKCTVSIGNGDVQCELAIAIVHIEHLPMIESAISEAGSLVAGAN